MAGHNDPATYRALSVPFASRDDAQRNIDEFLDGVRELRKKHHLRDVHVLIEVDITLEDGDEGSVRLDAHFGASTNALPMLASTYGAERARFDDALARAAASSGKAAKR